MKKVFWLILVFVVAAFVLGLSHLFRLRFEHGDVYPEYSSLRSDPLGCKAFFESLGQLRPTRRHYEPLSRLPVGEPATLFYLGAYPADLRFADLEFAGLENFVRTGGRLVVTLHPVYRPIRIPIFLRSGSPRSQGGKPSVTTHATNRWGLAFQYAPLDINPDGVYEPESAFRTGPAPTVPPFFSVATALWFTNLTDSWTVLYARTNNRPVLIERTWGKGSLVFCADSYPLSNQALLLERQPALLAWLAGGSARFIFDETHLGVQSAPGVASLLRKYHLHGFLGLLLLLASLYIWKNAFPFVPLPHSADHALSGRFVTGRESAAGFINLLRRNIPSTGLLGICLEQWKTQAGHPAKTSKIRLEKMQALIDEENSLPPRRRNPVRFYNEIARILSRRTRGESPPSPPAPKGRGMPAPCPVSATLHLQTFRHRP